MTTLCHCGRPLHYSNPESRAKIEKMVAELGEFVPVTCGGRSWRVSRHYIALHGVRAIDLPTLGFEEITP